MTTSLPDQSALEEGRQELRTLVREIAGLSRSEIAPQDFFQGSLQRIIEKNGAEAGAVWLCEEPSRVVLKFAERFNDCFSSPPGDWHAEALKDVIARGANRVLPPNQSPAVRGEPQNPTDWLLMFAPIRVGGQVRGVLELVLPPADARPQIGKSLRLLDQFSRLAGEYLSQYTLRELESRQCRTNKIAQFIDRVHKSLDLTETAYAIANAGRDVVQVDRLSVAVRDKNECRIVAISGQDVIDRRSNVVRRMRRLAANCVRLREPVWFEGRNEPLPPRVLEAYDRYSDVSQARSVGVIPLFHRATVSDRPDDDNDPVVGALILEQFQSAAFSPEVKQNLSPVARHAGLALGHAIAQERIFLLPVWRFLGRLPALASRRRRLLTCIVLLFTVLTVFAMMPTDFEVECRGELRPTVRRHVYAQFDGVVSNVAVRHGERVGPQASLVTLRNVDLEIAFRQLQGAISTTNDQLSRKKDSLLESPGLSPVERGRLHAEVAELRQKLFGLKEERILLERKRRLLIHYNPLPSEAEIVTWNVQERLAGRPVKRGQRLLTVADTHGPWEIEVRVPESRFGHVKQAQKQLGDDLQVEFILPGDAGTPRVGKVIEVRQAAELHDGEGNVVVIRVAIPADQLPDNCVPGTTVTARIHCGRKSRAYVHLHEVVEFIQSRVLFRF